MKRFLFFALFSCLSFPIFAQFQSCNSPTTKGLRDVFFIDANVGIAVGDSGIILRSGDGGSNWSIVMDVDSVNFTKVGFFDADHGVAIGSDLFQTSDGGFTWNLVPSGNDFFIDIEILDANTCIISGYPTALLKSTDQGATFTDLIGTNVNETYGLLSFVNASVGYSCRMGGGFTNITEKTTDGGISWQTLDDTLHPTNNTVMEAMEYYSEQVGFKGGWYASHLERSGNGGLGWGYVAYTDSMLYPALYDFHIDTNSPNAFYACGWYGEVFKSLDGGFTWKELDLGIPLNNQLYGIYFINELTGWVVGDGGLILKTTNGGGLVTAEQPSPDLNAQTFLYPNPSNGIFHLEAEEGSKNPSVTLYNALGQLVLELPSGSTVLDLSTYPNGLYWAAFSSGQGTHWQRIIKQ